MSKILNDSQLAETRNHLNMVYHLNKISPLNFLEIIKLFDHIDAMTSDYLVSLEAVARQYNNLASECERLATSLDAEAAAHSVTRAALVASPEWVDSPGGGNASCPHCHGLKWHEGHAPDCLRRVALEQAP